MLSCVTILALGLIQPCTRLDYLPPSASLITSNADHPMKTKSQMNVQVSKSDYTVCTESNQQGMRPKSIGSNEQKTQVYKAASYRYEPKHKSENICFKAESYRVKLTRYKTQAHHKHRSQHAKHQSKKLQYIANKV